MFKQIPFGAGNYYINEEGVVINTKFKKTRTLKLGVTPAGYLTVALYHNGYMKHFFVHNLVAMVFLVKKPGDEVVMHKDSNRQNCHLSNLKYGTQSENVQQAYDEGKIMGFQPYLWRLYHPTAPVYIEKFGRDAIGKIVDHTTGAVQWHSMTGVPFRRGPYKDWMVEKTNVQRSSDDVGGNIP